MKKYITTPSLNETRNSKSKKKLEKMLSVESLEQLQLTGKNQSKRECVGGLMSINVCLLCY